MLNIRSRRPCHARSVRGEPRSRLDHGARSPRRRLSQAGNFTTNGLSLDGHTSYIAAGDMTDGGRDCSFTYDARGRLVSAANKASTVDADGTLESTADGP